MQHNPGFLKLVEQSKQRLFIGDQGFNITLNNPFSKMASACRVINPKFMVLAHIDKMK